MGRQADSSRQLETHLVAGLPLVNVILDRLRVDELLDKVLPDAGAIPPARALGVLLRRILLADRRPIYTHAEWARRVEPSLLRLAKGDAKHLNDDRIGRALERLFDADRSAMLTDVVLRAVEEFGIDLDQLHNDSTTLTLTGDYRAAEGGMIRGKPTTRITYGHNKDHRPDLKQLLFVLTISADGAVPVHYSALHGNTNDSVTHIATWETLRKLAGRVDFLYVADCKLCSKANLEHISKAGGRFITVLPRNRREDRWFRKFVQVHEPPWQEAIHRPHPRRQNGADDVWKVVEAELPSKEGYRVVWVWNSLMALEDEESRQHRIERGWQAIERVQARLQGKRCRLRSRERVEEAVRKVLREARADRWVTAEIRETKEPVFRQEQRGHPGPKTKYVRKERLRFSVTHKANKDVVEADAKFDGMFPLISNAKDLSLKEILAAYKSQPMLEKRHEQLKSVQDMAPVWLKKISRIEGLLFLHFIALLVHALVERELRLAMVGQNLDMIPLYPEERECRAPCMERILQLFASLETHRLTQNDALVQIFQPKLDALQRKILHLLGIPAGAFQM